jgi:hypothetical protein
MTAHPFFIWMMMPTSYTSEEGGSAETFVTMAELMLDWFGFRWRLAREAHGESHYSQAQKTKADLHRSRRTPYMQSRIEKRERFDIDATLWFLLPQEEISQQQRNGGDSPRL